MKLTESALDITLVNL